jgi:hypothetical protein
MDRRPHRNARDGDDPDKGFGIAMAVLLAWGFLGAIYAVFIHDSVVPPAEGDPPPCIGPPSSTC